jgi:hypothetical protein
MFDMAMPAHPNNYLFCFADASLLQREPSEVGHSRRLRFGFQQERCLRNRSGLALVAGRTPACAHGEASSRVPPLCRRPSSQQHLKKKDRTHPSLGTDVCR